MIVAVVVAVAIRTAPSHRYGQYSFRDGDFLSAWVEDDVFADGDDEEGYGGAEPLLLLLQLLLLFLLS